MFKWLLALLALLFPVVSGDNTDYVGKIAAHAAYASLQTTAAPVKPKVPTKDCTTCKGTGQVPTGDSNHPWTRCPDCDGIKTGTGAAEKPPTTTPDAEVKVPKSDPTRYTQPPAGTRLVR